MEHIDNVFWTGENRKTDEFNAVYADEINFKQRRRKWDERQHLSSTRSLTHYNTAALPAGKPRLPTDIFHCQISKESQLFHQLLGCDSKVQHFQFFDIKEERNN